MQILVIAVGEFGVNIACKFFQHLVIEHNLVDGVEQQVNDNSLFFSECAQKGAHRANLLLFDTTDDPYFTMVKSSPLLLPFVNRSQIFHLHELEGVSQHYTVAGLKKQTALKDRIRDSLRRELEKKTFQSILLIHSICGGTGSGLTMAVLGDLQILKSKSCNIVNLMLMPSDGLHSTNSLEWYNAAASLETINDACDLTIMLDNQALYRVYQQSILGNGVDENNQIKLADLNHLIVSLLSSLTGSQRYKSEVPKRFQDIIVNTVLYRCIHFVVPAVYDPRSLVQNYGQQHRDSEMLQQSTLVNRTILTPQLEPRYARYAKQYTIKSLENCQNYASPISILVDLFNPKNTLATCENEKDKYVSSFTAFNVPHEETLINQAYIHTKEYLVKATQIDFMSMSPCPAVFSLTHKPLLNCRQEGLSIYTQPIEVGACMLQNKFTIHNIFDRIHRNVTRMFQHGAYRHWIDSQEMQHSVDIVKCLERDYGDWFQAEEIVHLFEESLREDEIQSQSDSLSDTF